MERYRLAELAAVSGTAARTIRYYIAEGLLPPPVGSGPSAAYTAGHRDRLALIARLKGRYLPLRAIAEHLAALDDGAVRAELARIETTPAPSSLEGQGDSVESPAPVTFSSMPARDLWARVILADGVELHVRADRLRQPVPLDALVQQARRLLGEE